jgi:serine protease Do
MSKRTTLAAIALVAVGIVLGAAALAGLGGFSLSFAGGEIRFNTEAPYTPPASVASLNEAFTKVSEIVTPSVVSITVNSKAERPQGYHFFFPFGQPEDQQQDEQLQQGTGSGIIISADGYILTNKHVVEGATSDGITVTLHDSREFRAAKVAVVGTDANTDIAVIKIDATGLTAASIGNSDDVRVGEWVLAVGNPLGLNSTVTAGIVSAISRNINIINSRTNDGTGIENFIQTDAAVNPGNSGGALVNLRGQVVGVNTAIATETGRYIGYSFAVPINLAKTVAQGIIKDGRFVRGYIGVRISNLDSKKAKALGMDRFKGVLVESLQEDGAGKAAGIRPGDAIVEVDGREVQSSNELQARVGMHHPGETVALKLFRNGKYIDMNVTLKARDAAEEEETTVTRKDDARDDEGSVSVTSFDKAGFSVKPLDAQARKRFKRDDGVLVTDVKQFGPAYENNLRPNVVIFEVRKGGTVTEVAGVADLKKILGALKEGESVLLRVATEKGDTAFVPIEGPVK